MKKDLPADEWMLERGQSFSTAVEPHAPMWQVEQGVLLVKGALPSGEGAWSLALPGDWLNLPCVCGLEEAAQVTALLPSRLRALPQTERLTRESLLSRLVAQQQRWSAHLMALRSGPVEQRVRHLLALTHRAMGGTLQGASASMPILRDVATLVDAVPETVCRVLTRLRPHPRERTGRDRRLASA